MLRTGLNLHLALNWVVINTFGSNLDPVPKEAWPHVSVSFPCILIPSYNRGTGGSYLSCDRAGNEFTCFFSYLFQINLINPITQECEVIKRKEVPGMSKKSMIKTWRSLRKKKKRREKKEKYGNA